MTDEVDDVDNGEDCDEGEEVVQEGQVAVIHYVCRVAEGREEGEVFDTTDVDVALAEDVYHDHRDYKPLEFRVGEGNVVEGLDEAVVGMERGEEKTVEVEPERAFGERDPDEVVEFPREMFDDEEVEEDTLVGTEDGRTGWVVDVSRDTVTVDFNHELSGKSVRFEVKLLDVHGEPGEEAARTWEKKRGVAPEVVDEGDEEGQG